MEGCSSHACVTARHDKRQIWNGPIWDWPEEADDFSFGNWKTMVAMLPQYVQSDATSRHCYYPVTTPVEGYYQPIDNMEALCPDNPETDNTYVPIQWDEECVIPPYEDFYDDGIRFVPSFNHTLPTNRTRAHCFATSGDERRISQPNGAGMGTPQLAAT
eukprot:3729652-Amphidinium_carterae.1